MELVLLGPPGSGKGTQAKFLAARFHIPHVSTGDLFRTYLQQGEELGRMAKKYLDAGTLVPDDVTEAMVKDRLSNADAQGGFITDGFPRNLSQAEHFDLMLGETGRSLTAVLYLKVGKQTLVHRLTGRRVCSQCGALYHLEFNPPKVDGVCDVCASPLIQRPDDSEETVLTRLAVYHTETEPLVAYYRGRGVLIEFDGEEPVDAVTRAIAGTLENGRD